MLFGALILLAYVLGVATPVVYVFLICRISN
jgi:hypothetical protein